MPDSGTWHIVYYVDEQGSSPVLEFLQSLDERTVARFDWSIEQLRLRNTRATAPLVRHIDGRLWELRRTSNGNIYRIMYFFFTGRRIVFVHGFQKKTEKTPHREIEIATRRMEAYIARHGDE